MNRLLAPLLAVALALQATPARAWGDEGHEIVALIANALLRPQVRLKVQSMLALDEDPLTAHDIPAEATWADHFRDADPDGARARTWRWHFVDLELTAPSLDTACFGHPGLPPGTPVSLGPAHDCIVDKIDQFAAELASPATQPDERLVALKFLLHFVGDVHQPLHAADDDDRGGNRKRVSAEGVRRGNLHHFWDTVFVRAIGDDPRDVATELLHAVSQEQIRRWSGGTPAEWAFESYHIAVRDAYGLLPPPSRRGAYRLSDLYVRTAIRDCREQLTKAGVRLAALLNRTLAPPSN